MSFAVPFGLSVHKIPFLEVPPSSPRKVQFIAVEPDVKIEVFDWGGSGPPVILIAGLGNTAYILDDCAPKFVTQYHVYGITRSGFGTSSSPLPNDSTYVSDRLGDDGLKVMNVLGTEKLTTRMAVLF